MGGTVLHCTCLIIPESVGITGANPSSFLLGVGFRISQSKISTRPVSARTRYETPAGSPAVELFLRTQLVRVI